MTGHAGQGALPGNDRGCRISDYYRSGRILVFKLISWLAGERHTSADSWFMNILGWTPRSQSSNCPLTIIPLSLGLPKAPLDLALASQPLVLYCTSSLHRSKPVTVWDCAGFLFFATEGTELGDARCQLGWVGSKIALLGPPLMDEAGHELP